MRELSTPRVWLSIFWFLSDYSFDGLYGQTLMMLHRTNYFSRSFSLYFARALKYDKAKEFSHFFKLASSQFRRFELDEHFYCLGHFIKLGFGREQHAQFLFHTMLLRCHTLDVFPANDSLNSSNFALICTELLMNAATHVLLLVIFYKCYL